MWWNSVREEFEVKIDIDKTEIGIIFGFDDESNDVFKVLNWIIITGKYYIYRKQKEGQFLLGVYNFLGYNQIYMYMYIGKQKGLSV